MLLCGFVLNGWNTNPAATGAAFLGVMNFDGTGKLTGTIPQIPTLPAAITITVDLGATLTRAMVTTDGGQGLQLAVTSCPVCNNIGNGRPFQNTATFPNGSYALNPDGTGNNQFSGRPVLRS